jgi:hypothetical protein
MSYPLFPIPSSGCALLPTRAERLSLTRYQSQSTIPTATPYSTVGGTLTAPNFGSSPSLCLLHLQRTCHLWLQQLGDYQQPCQQACRTPAKASRLLAPPGRTSRLCSCGRQPNLWPWQPTHPALPTTRERLTSPALAHLLASTIRVWASLSSKRG